MSDYDPYSTVRRAEAKDHLKKWDAAANRLGLNPNDAENWPAIRTEYQRV